MNNELIDKELNNEEQQYVQDASEVQALAAQESALVAYIPKSKAAALDTLIPRNMAFEIQKALNDTVKQHGNVDNYVRDHLKYPSVEQLWKSLAAEQVDAIALYLNQFDHNQGIIIADQTGIGKGRQAAAVIRHAIMNGYLPVFFTRNPELFSDLYRDLQNIGFKNIHPFIVNTDADARIKDSGGEVVFSPLSSERQYDLIVIEKQIPTESPESIEWHKKNGMSLPDPEKVPLTTITEVIDYVPGDYDCILCTYSQVQAAQPYKRMWLAKLAERGVEGSKRNKKVVFVLDESHMAGGFDSIIGKWMRNVLPHTKACCYLSATFAKYPEVMPFYGKKTAIQETELSDDKFVFSMERGGLALQEIVASNLAECGQLIRRQRSSEGIRVDYTVLDEEPARSKNRERVNQMIALMNEVVSFEQDYIDPMLGEIHTKARSRGEHLEKKPMNLGVKQSPYFSRVFNIIDQLLFALKAEAVAHKAIELLNEDKKVVIVFKSTMGSFLKDLNLVSGDRVEAAQMDFALTLIKGLDSVFFYNYTDIDGAKSRQKIDLEDLPENGIKKYKQIRKAMVEESTGLSISPIDELIHILENTPKPSTLGGHKGKTFRVAEVTGRNQRLHFEDSGAIVQSFRTDTEKFVRLFNAGEYDVLLLNQSGSTGISAHASKDFKDQRTRAMIIHQFELDINVEMQKRGRIHRTGEVTLPEYYNMTSDIPAEKRLMTMLKSKLKSLDANTTGSQKTSEDTVQSADFFNKYGDLVAWKWIEDNPELAEKMGKPTFHKKNTKNGSYYERNESREGAIRQVTGRAGLLLVEEQDILYKDLLSRYEAQIQWEKQRGTYDLEIEFLKLDAEVKKRFLFLKGKGGKTPFGRDTVREESIVNNLKRPFTKDEVDKILTDAMDGQKPKQVQLQLINQINKDYPAIVEERKAKRLDTLGKLQQELAALPQRDSSDTAEENEKIDRQHARLEDLIQEKTQSLSSYINELEEIQKQINRLIQYWQIGEVVKVPVPEAGTVLPPSWGIFLGVDIGKSSSNPYTLANIYLKFAVVDSRRLVEYNLSQEQRGFISNIYTESKEITPEDIRTVTREWNDMVKEASQKREKRHILTGNIVLASGYIGSFNKLIKYNTREGSIKNGIMLYRGFGKEGEDKFAMLAISAALPIISELKIDAEFSDLQDRVTVKRVSANYFQVYIHKRGNFELHTDPVLRSLIKRAEGQSEDELPDFVQNAGDMSAALHIQNLERFLERLSSFGLQYMGEATEIQDWEKENEADWSEKTQSKGSFRYKLSRAYGQGTNPTVGFINYEEPDKVYPFGVVVFDRPLTDKEKYNYSLIPLYTSVEVPYQAWKQFLESSPALKAEFAAIVKEASVQPYWEAILTLGYFIFNNPHQDGNTEFVYGEYGVEALGQIAYQDQIGEVSEMDTIISQLEIELQKL